MMANKDEQSESNMTIWQKRRQALGDSIREALPKNARIVETASELSTAQYSIPGLSTLETLAECLDIFTQEQFNFFHKGFFGKNGYTLIPSREYPEDFVFKVILEQSAEDLEAIRRIADQRRSPTMRPSLENADKLAWSVLAPIVGRDKLIDEKGVNPSTTVVTYFQKAVTIRVIPYAPVALIGIPFTTISKSLGRDYLAIPHEVGHYVYRHVKLAGGRSIPQTLGKSLLDKDCPRWVRRWKEEIFADVYGCLIGGPVTALSIQDLMLQTSRAPIIQTPGEYYYGQFAEDDGIHPVPVLRPYVYTKTLRKRMLSWVGTLDPAPLVKKWTTTLDELWNNLLTNLDLVNVAEKFIEAPELSDKTLAEKWNEELKRRQKELPIDEKDRGQLEKAFRQKWAMELEFKLNQEYIDKLDENWKKQQQVQETTDFRSRYVGGSSQYVSVNETLQHIDTVIDEVLTLLQPVASALSIWSGDSKETDINNLYTRFETKGIKTLLNDTIRPAELDFPGNKKESLWRDWAKRENFFPGFRNGLPPQGTIIEPGKSYRLEELEQEPRYTWNHVFLAGGWATRPHGPSGSGVVFPKNWPGQNDVGGSGGY